MIAVVNVVVIAVANIVVIGVVNVVVIASFTTETAIAKRIFVFVFLFCQLRFIHF